MRDLWLKVERGRSQAEPHHTHEMPAAHAVRTLRVSGPRAGSFDENFVAARIRHASEVGAGGCEQVEPDHMSREGAWAHDVFDAWQA